VVLLLQRRRLPLPLKTWYGSSRNTYFVLAAGVHPDSGK
jgi:hypothetical protein